MLKLNEVSRERIARSSWESHRAQVHMGPGFTYVPTPPPWSPSTALSRTKTDNAIERFQVHERALGALDSLTGSTTTPIIYSLIVIIGVSREQSIPEEIIKIIICHSTIAWPLIRCNS